ncbi:MAG: hypothetical protein GEV08_22655 [Acidimicrobiia bacterium]|nr:hypothetical protein [Acidimicrobiia bacterium]
MALQNRVTPRGDLVAVVERGTFMGNRGRLHDEHRRVRRWADGRRWIICVLEFRGRHRRVMAPNRYTELFFLDEATALAAGHRPCYECRREDYQRFLGAWLAARPSRSDGAKVRAEELDRALDAERRQGRHRRTFAGHVDELPDGAMVERDGEAALVLGGRLLTWSPGGYGPARPAPTATLTVLTPASTVAALRQGYQPVLHPSAR